MSCVEKDTTHCVVTTQQKSDDKFSIRYQMEHLQGFVFPRLTQIPAFYDLEQSIMAKDTQDTQDITIVHAPTGEGKTVMISILMGLYARKYGSRCSVAMPYRITVTEMHKYLLKYQKAYNQLYDEIDDIQFGFAIKDYKSTNTINDDVTLYTSGYFLELLVSIMNQKEKQVIFIDEAHDPSWQTHLLLHLVAYARQFVPIKVIIASATLNKDRIQDIFKSTCNIFNFERFCPSITTIEYYRTNINCDGDRTLSYGLLEQGVSVIERYVSNIYQEYSFDTNCKKNILVLLPGMQAITELEQLLVKNKGQGFSQCQIYIMHSIISKEEIEEALNDKTSMCKIFLATNIVENAITIDNLTHLVDFGYRMNQIIDEDGNIHKNVIKASKSNIVQTQGRVGRQGIASFATLMMSKEQYECLPEYPQSEVDVNPLYNQLLRLYPFFPDINTVANILHSIDPEKITKDTKYLIEKTILKIQDDDICVTEFGKKVKQLKLSIPVACFLVKCCDTPKEECFLPVLISAFVDCGQSIFHRARAIKPNPAKNIIGQTKEENQMELDAKHERFLSSDTLRSSIMVYLCYLEESKYSKFSIKVWCYKNGIFEKTFKEICKTIQDIICDLKQMYRHRLNIRQNIWFSTFNTMSWTPSVSNHLETTFANRVFEFNEDCYVRGSFVKSIDPFSVCQSSMQPKIVAFLTRCIRKRQETVHLITFFTNLN